MKNRKRSLFALVQHPMIYLIHRDRGDPPVGERVPDWGAPDMETYAGRVRRNLEAMERHPDLKLNYEFSALELEILAECAPELLPVMRRLVGEGRLAFVGGDYSQPHGQLYSGELNFRQLETGLRIFRELVGYRVKNNYHQETCLHDQLPQLLRAFGLETGSPPAFAHAVIPVECREAPVWVNSDFTGYVPAAPCSTALWRGLDGTELPVVITGISSCGFDENRMVVEEHKGMYRASPLVISAPDMEEIEEERYAFIRQHGETVLLDEAVAAQVAERKASWVVKLDTHWSYSEGQWAEALYRGIREAESALLAEEAVCAATGAQVRAGFESDWRQVLAAMHHDVHWIEVTDLKEQSLRDLEGVAARSNHRLAELANAREGLFLAGTTVRVVNPLPRRRSELARFRRAGADPMVLCAAGGDPVPTLCVPDPDGKAQTVYFLADVPPLSAADYQIRPGSSLAAGFPCRQAQLQAGKAAYTVERNGVVSAAAWGAHNLLAGPGHALRYLDEKEEVVGGAGREGEMIRYSGDGITVLRISAPVGTVPVELTVAAARQCTLLDIHTTFRFDSHEIGVMWEDWTKLNACWEVGDVRIRHDIPYGAVDGREILPMYAPGWVAACGREGTLGILNAGTPKHFYKEGELACVFAWGGRTFSNRMHMNWLEKQQYDLTLKGTHTIRTGVLALPPDAPESDLAEAAQDYGAPMPVLEARGKWTAGMEVPDLAGSGLVVTSVLPGAPVRMRFYEAQGKLHALDRLREAGIRMGVTDLQGNSLEEISPYRIGYLVAE